MSKKKPNPDDNPNIPHEVAEEWRMILHTHQGYFLIETNTQRKLKQPTLSSFDRRITAIRKAIKEGEPFAHEFVERASDALVRVRNEINEIGGPLLDVLEAADDQARERGIIVASTSQKPYSAVVKYRNIECYQVAEMIIDLDRVMMRAVGAVRSGRIDRSNLKSVDELAAKIIEIYQSIPFYEQPKLTWPDVFDNSEAYTELMNKWGPIREKLITAKRKEYGR